MRSIRLLLVIAIVGIAAGAIAQVKRSSSPVPPPYQPSTINVASPISFHGRLTDSNGNAVTGQVNLVLSLYTDQASTTVIWTETHAVTPQDGWFSLLLGETTPFPAWNGASLWLGVAVSGDAEMLPRTPLLPVPYALFANPTLHAETHALGGLDQLGSQTPLAGELVRATDGGVISPDWLPAATSGSLGVVQLNTGSGSGGVVTGADPRLTNARTPLPHATTHEAGGSDPVATATPAANAIPQASASGQLAPGWLPTASVSSIGGYTLYSSSNTSGVVQGTDSRLSNARTPTPHAATHEANGSDPIGTAAPGTPGSVPYANSSGYLDNWIQQLPQAQGGTGTNAPRTTRNLCFFIAGPSNTTSIPTLMVPPGANSCTAVSMYASAQTAPSQAIAYNIIRVNTSSSNLFGSNGSWSGSVSNIGPTGSTAVSAGDVLAPSISGAGVNNATFCVQLSCAPFQ